MFSFSDGVYQPKEDVVAASSVQVSHHTTQKDLIGSILSDHSHSSIKSLGDIGYKQLWDFSLPTFTWTPHAQSSDTKRNLCLYTTEESLVNAIKVHNQGITYGLLSRVGVFDDEKCDVALHGESLVDFILNHRQGQDHDISGRVLRLRLVGAAYTRNQQACLERAKEIVSEVTNFLEKENKNLTTIGIHQMQKKQNENLRAGVNVKPEETHMHAVAVSLFKLDELMVCRMRNVITIIVPGRAGNEGEVKATRLELTCWSYEDIPQLLCASYPHCAQIAILGGRVMVTDAAQYCLQSACIFADDEALRQHHYNQSDLQHRLCIRSTPSTSSEAADDVKAVATKQKQDREQNVRAQAHIICDSVSILKKYFDKGFDIVLPQLDMSKIPDRNFRFGVQEVLDLPQMTVILDNIQEKRILVDEIRLSCSCRANRSSSRISSRIGGCDFLLNSIGVTYSSTDPHPPAFSSIAIDQHNVKCLVRDHYSNFIYSSSGAGCTRTGFDIDSVLFDVFPRITPRMIDECYTQVEAKLSQDAETGLGYVVSPRLVFDYFCATPSYEVMEKLIIQPLREMEESHSQSHSHCHYYSPQLFEESDSTRSSSTIESFVNLEKQVAKDKLSKLRQTMESLSMDNFLCTERTEAVVTLEQVREALYGEYIYNERQAEI
jgi:hypothetical protein